MSLCPSITGIGIKALVNSLPRLERIDLAHCENISPDAITWARGTGVTTTTTSAEWPREGKYYAYEGGPY